MSDPKKDPEHEALVADCVEFLARSPYSYAQIEEAMKQLMPERPSVTSVLPFVFALYQERAECSRGSGAVGGHLHIVLDDGNTEYVHVQFCYDEADRDGCIICKKIAAWMMQMSSTQRAKLYTMAHERKRP